MSTTGKALQWYRELFHGKGTSYQALLNKAAASPPGAGGLIFLPWLSGIRTPWWDPLAQGVFLGMNLQHREEDFIRAIIEGVALGINQMIRIFISHGAEPTEIRACGGQSRSGLWNQIKADVTGIPVKIPRLTDGEILGMALLAGKGAGIFTDIKDTAERLVKISREYVPDPENHSFYASLQEVYEGLYQPLKASFAHLSSLKVNKREGAPT
jgi:xylulokinase